MPLSLHRILNNMLVAYCAIAIIYWLPGFSDLRLYKLLLICLISLSTFTLIDFRVNRGIVKALLFGTVLWVFSKLSTFFWSTSSVIIEEIFDFIILLTFIITSSLLATKNIRRDYIINLPTIAISLFTTLHLFGVFFLHFNDYIPIKDGYTTFKEIGFNLSRTGWSSSLSFFVPLFFLRKNKIVAILLLIPVIASQVLCAGRGGLIASIITIYFVLFRSRKWNALLLISVIAGILIYKFSDIIFLSMRMNRLSSGSGDSLNSFSAGRLESYKIGLGMFLDNPVFGLGANNADISSMVSYSVKDIHNVFVKNLVEAGIFGISYIIYALGCIYLLIKKTVRNREVLNYALATLTTGIILMNLEPNSVFGSFQNSIGFWYMPYVIMTYRSE